MSGVFRELFVELGREAFEIAKGLGEAAVVEAEQRLAPIVPSRVSTMLNAFNECEHAAHRYVLSRYGWRAFVIHRRAEDDRIVIHAKLHCGHRIKLRSLGEIAFHVAPVGSLIDTFIAALDRRVLEAEYCYCVRQEGWP